MPLKSKMKDTAPKKLKAEAHEYDHKRPKKPITSRYK